MEIADGKIGDHGRHGGSESSGQIVANGKAEGDIVANGQADGRAGTSGWGEANGEAEGATGPLSSAPLLVLASSSPYRRRLLRRLQIPFVHAAPDIDETPLPGEAAPALVRRLAEAKARALAPRFPAHLLIGSDQVAVVDDRILGKPGDKARAVEQLRLASGRAVTFLTGLCLWDSRSGVGIVDCVPFTVHFRELTEAEIHAYLDTDLPFDCAGSFRSEELGVALFARTEGEDPTAIEGLPLIRLTGMLRAAGICVLTTPRPGNDLDRRAPGKPGP